MSLAIQQAINAANLDTQREQESSAIQVNPKIRVERQVVTTDSSMANPVTGIGRLAKALIVNPATGVYAGANELVAATATGVAKLTGNEALRDSFEESRGELQYRLDVARDADSSSTASQILYGISKFIGPSAGIGSIVKAGLTRTATLGATTGVVGYQETKSNLIEEGVDRSTANTAGLVYGAGVGASVALPVAGILGKASSAGKVAADVAASTTLGTAIGAGSQYAAGALVQEAGYEKQGQAYKDMATSPVALGISLAMGGVLGGIVGAGNLKAYQATTLRLNNLAKPVDEGLTPEVLEAIANKEFDNPLVVAYLNDKGIDEWAFASDSNFSRPERMPLPTKEEYDADPIFAQKQIDEINEAFRKDVRFNIIEQRASGLRYKDLASAGILSDSDAMLIYRNEAILYEFNRTGDELLLDRLEIPQVHRDVYSLTNSLDEADIRESYFGLEGMREAYEAGQPYVSPHIDNVTSAYITPKVLGDDTRAYVSEKLAATNTSDAGPIPVTGRVKTALNNISRAIVPPERQPGVIGISERIGKGEGDYLSYNNGIAGDANGAKLPEGITIGQIMERQKGKPETGRTLFAVGKHQMIPSTLEEAVRVLKIDPNSKFTPELQERIFKQYLMRKKPGRGVIYSYITSEKEGNIVAAQEAIAAEFASVGMPATGISRYAGKGGNKASITPESVKIELQAQRVRYQELIKQGINKEEAWDLSFAPREQRALSATVQADKANTVSTNRDGEVFEDWRRLDVNTTPDKRSLLDLILNRQPNTYDLAITAAKDKGIEGIAAESRAIQRVYEEKSYQHALEQRKEAVDRGTFTPQELENITQNAFKVSQESFRGGQSKIFDEEYRNALANSPNATVDELTEVALKGAQARFVRTLLTNVGRPAADVTREAASKVEDTAIGKNIQGKKVVEESNVVKRDSEGNLIKDTKVVRYVDKEGNVKFKTVKNEEGKVASTESKVKFEDGTIATRITTALPSGKVISRVIETNNTSRVRELSNEVDRVIGKDDIVTINGTTLSRSELQTLINNTRTIDDKALQEFALCALF